MKIRLYECTDPDVPASHRWVAMCFDRAGPLPVRHFGAESEALRERVRTWWDEQVAKAAAKSAKPTKKKAADPGDVI